MLNLNIDSSTYNDLFALLKTDLISVYYAGNLKKYVENVIKKEIKYFYETFLQQRGVILPVIQFRESITLENNAYNIFIRDQHIKTGFILNENIIISQDNNNYFEKKCFFEFNTSGQKTRGLKIQQETDLQRQEIISPCAIFFNDLTNIITFNIDQILTIKYVSHILECIHIENPALYKLLMENNISEPVIKKILISLIHEGLSIKDIEYIMEKIIDHTYKTSSIEQLIDWIRIDFKRQISNQFLNYQNKINAVTLSSDFEEKLIDYFTNYEHLDLNSFQRILKKLLVKSILDKADKHFDKLNSDPVILTSNKLRRHLYNLLFPYNNFITVLAYDEILPDVRVEILGVIDDDQQSSIIDVTVNMDVFSNTPLVCKDIEKIIPDDLYVQVKETIYHTHTKLLNNLPHSQDLRNSIIDIYERLLNEYIVRIMNLEYPYKYLREAIITFSNKFTYFLLNQNKIEVLNTPFITPILQNEALKLYDSLVVWIEQAMTLENKFEKS